jgi:tetratricopeptide (TPR) repeat protein
MPAAAPDPERTREEQLFYRALDLPPPERSRFLQHECASAPLLRQRLEALLSAHDSSSGFLERPAATRLPADPELVPGAHVGRYTLLREIGEGASGIVFHARQLEPIQRDVAIKVIKLGMDTREVIARFEAERQALALLDHPDIAHVLDAGATSSGRPFFVMELVAGAPITRFADAERMSVSARIELMIRVCAAVEHAHQKGVIHRDLKPSNILVANAGGAARPKIIDFGVAKATSAQRGHTVATALGSFLGTPGYLSPEQAEAGAAAVDTRSDIYSLGALLCELLVGAPPFGSRQGPDLLRKLRDEEPPRLSTRVRSLPAAELAAIAQARNSTPKKLHQEIAGDLEWIVAQCLERDPDRRYATVGDLAADLRRHLALAPVRARPPAFAYVFGRLVRRHRALASVIAASVVLLAAATALSLRFAWQAARAELEARRETTATRQMTEFLQNDLLAAAAQETQPVWDLRWRGVLDRAAARIAGRFDDRPALAAGMHATLGASYRTLGDFSAAQHHYERAFFLRSLAQSQVDEELLAIADGLTGTLHSQGNFAPILRLWRQIEHTLPRDAALPLRLRILRELARAECDARDASSALFHSERAIALAAGASGTDSPEYFRSLHTLALVQHGTRRFSAAVSTAERAVAGLHHTSGPDARETLAAMTTLARCYRFDRRLPEAEQLYRDVIARLTRLLGADHPAVLAAKSELSFVFQEAGRYDEAIALADEEIAVKRRVMGPEHPLTLNAMTNRGYQQQLAARFDDAIATHREVLAIRERIHGPRHVANASSLFGIGVALRVSQRAAESIPWLRRACALRTELLGAENRDTLLAASELGFALAETGCFAESAAILAATVANFTRTDPESWNVAVAQSRFAEPLIALHRFDEAEAALHSAHKRLSRDDVEVPPATRPQLREIAQRFVRLYSLWGRPADAAQWEQRLAALRAP